MTMVIPMLVLLAHDIVPHHHHVFPKSKEHKASSHSHTHIHDANCGHHHHHGEKHWSHQHSTAEEGACILAHHRAQKELKYQVFLKVDYIDFRVKEDQSTKKFFVSDYRLIPEPIKFIHLLRAPPYSHS